MRTYEIFCCNQYVDIGIILFLYLYCYIYIVLFIDNIIVFILFFERFFIAFALSSLLLFLLVCDIAILILKDTKIERTETLARWVDR